MRRVVCLLSRQTRPMKPQPVAAASLLLAQVREELNGHDRQQGCDPAHLSMHKSMHIAMRRYACSSAYQSLCTLPAYICTRTSVITFVMCICALVSMFRCTFCCACVPLCYIHLPLAVHCYARSCACTLSERLACRWSVPSCLGCIKD